MPRPGKTSKITGSQAPKIDTTFSAEANRSNRPMKVSYQEVTSEAPNTSLGPRLEDVFIPFYDRPGYTTDNAAQQSKNGKMFRIPSTSGPTGGGTMPERNLGA